MLDNVKRYHETAQRDGARPRAARCASAAARSDATA
jgi:hypothetical protein